MPAQGAPSVQSSAANHGYPPAQPPAHMSAPAAGTGAPSLAGTAITSAVGAAVGSMVGTAVSNSLSRKSGGSIEESNSTTTSTLSPTAPTALADFSSTSTTSASDVSTNAAYGFTYPSTLPHTTRFAATTEAPTSTQAARSPLDGQAGVRLAFPGVGQPELQNILRGSHSFGTSVQDAVVRSLGVSAGRVVLQDVSVFPGASEKEPPSTMVTLLLLPDERLLPTEPSAEELADEITRQLSHGTSYLTRQLRLAFPQLPDAALQAGVVKTVALAGVGTGVSSASKGKPPVGTWVLCTLLAGTLVWL